MRGMRDISAIDLVKEIKIGWNLGNTLDAPTETAWGNPRTTKAMIEKVREMGFNASECLLPGIHTSDLLRTIN